MQPIPWCTCKAIARAMRAHLLVDAIRKAMIVSDALDVALPQQTNEPKGHGLPQKPVVTVNAHSQENTVVQMSSEEGSPARYAMGNPDFNEVAVLYAHEEACHANVVVRINKWLRN